MKATALIVYYIVTSNGHPRVVQYTAGSYTSLAECERAMSPMGRYLSQNSPELQATLACEVGS